jgi:hypothetical protein
MTSDVAYLMLHACTTKRGIGLRDKEGLCTLLRGRAASFLRTVALAGPFHAKEQEELALNNRS